MKNKRLINVDEIMEKQSDRIRRIGVFGSEGYKAGVKLAKTFKECGESLEEISKTMEQIPSCKREQIHKYLKTGFGLTQLDCITIYGYINLASFIYVLRKRFGPDYIVNDKLRNHKTGAKYVSYRINKKYLT